MDGWLSEMSVSGPVANGKDALRRIRRSSIKGSGNINPIAFEPRANGNDRDGPFQLQTMDTGNCIVESSRPIHTLPVQQS
jgi:hypothetical protein